MAGKSGQSVWRLARKQHGRVTRAQLLALGFTSRAIEHRLRTGRLHVVRRGVYAVGRPDSGPLGAWMAAVLACGPGAALSHFTAAVHLGLRRPRGERIEISVPERNRSRPPGLVVHRRRGVRVVEHDGIPTVCAVDTIVDIAPRVADRVLEAMINEADKLDLVHFDALRRELDKMPPRRGVRRVRSLLDRHTFSLTDSELERLFLRLVREAGLPIPLTQQRVNGYRVDFWWPDLGLIVETDGLRYHRTPAQQTRDRERDQAHTAAGLTVIRFTADQLRRQQAHVRATLIAVTSREAHAS